MGHCIERECAPPTPAPPSQPFAVELRIHGQNAIERGYLIPELHRAEIAVGGLRKIASASSHSAVIDMQDREAVLRKYLVEENCAPVPLVGDRLGAGAAIGIENQGNALLARSGWRGEPTGHKGLSLPSEAFNSSGMDAINFTSGGAFQKVWHFSLAVAEIHHRRRVGGGNGVGKKFRIGRKDRIVPASGGTHLVLSRAVQLNGPYLLLSRIALVGEVVDGSR